MKDDSTCDFKVALIGDDGMPVPDWVAPQLAEQGIELVHEECTNDDEVVLVAGDADVVWVCGGSRVLTATTLQRLPQCGVILRTGSGTDNIPVEAATRLGIVVANTPQATAQPVAEHAITLLLAVIRRVAVQDKAVREGRWEPDPQKMQWRLGGATLGLVGFGQIARYVAQKISSLGLHTIAYDPVVDAKTMAEYDVASVEFEELLARADFISIHCPLTDQTHHLIGEQELRKMKTNAVLINTARGKLIDESALIRALSEGWIAAAGLDVFEHEPPSTDNPLLKLDNVVMTPHIAAYTPEFPYSFWSHSVRTLIEMSRNRWPLWYVNRDVKPRWERPQKQQAI